MLNGGKISVGSGVMFSYGNQSPAVDAVPLAWTAGDVRQYMGGTDPTIVRYQCTVSGTPGTWVTVTAGGGTPSAPQLVGRTNRSTDTVWLDEIGTTDYVHWFPDLSGVSGSPVRRSGGAGLSDYTPLLGCVPQYLGSFAPGVVVWDTGTPIAAGSDAAVVYCIPTGAGDGFGWSADADTDLRVAHFLLQVAGGSSGCLFTATMSDGSSPPFTWTQLIAGTLNVTLEYRAGGPGETVDCSLVSLGDTLPVLRAFALTVP